MLRPCEHTRTEREEQTIIWEKYENVGILYQMAAKGLEDEHMYTSTSKSASTQFKATTQTHTRFSIENAVFALGKYQFGKTITHELPKRGSLIRSMFLKVKLPDITDDDCVYQNNTGFRLIKKVQIKCDKNVLAEYTGQLMYILHKLQRKESKDVGYYNMLGVQESSAEENLSGAERTLYIPLRIWDGEDWEEFFPIGSLTNQQVVLYIELDTSDSVTVRRTDSEVKVNLKVSSNGVKSTLITGLTTAHKLDMELYVDYIYLNEHEKFAVQYEYNHYVFRRYLHYEEDLAYKDFSTELPFNKPVEQLLWVVHSPKDKLNFEVVDSTTLILGDIDSKVDFDKSYYNIIQPYFHGNTIPDDNIYMYSFALLPFNKQPNGSVLLAKLQKKALRLQGDYRGKYISIYAQCISFVETKRGSGVVKLNI